MEHLKELIREAPDFPNPGINFYHITTLMKNAAGLREVIDAFQAHDKNDKIMWSAALKIEATSSPRGYSGARHWICARAKAQKAPLGCNARG